MEIYSQLKLRLKEYGAEYSIVSSSHLVELESEYNMLLKNSLIDKQLLKRYIRNYIDFSVISKYPAVRSLIVIATPSPKIDVKFNFNDSTYWLKIPPTYCDRKKITGNIKKITSQIFDSKGYQTFSVILPKKLLAVHSGLAKYGKNNLCYIPGMGSYNRLTAFASDLPCEYDSWQDLQVLEKCSNCVACQNNCPTTAINAEQFVIKAERCLTYMNEQSDPFPDWIDSKSHNSVIGCMRCQDVCPENKKFSFSIENKDEFSETETGLILKEISFEELPEKLQLKFDNLGLKHHYRHFSRNLSALFEIN